MPSEHDDKRALTGAFRPAVLLGAFAAIGVGLLWLIHVSTADRISANERAFILRNLDDLLPRDRYDNDPLADIVSGHDPELLGTEEPTSIWRVRRDGNPVAAVLQPVAPDGYSGDIALLVAVAFDGTLLGVRVTSHRETPGLGDAIERRRSDWILDFDNRSLENPEPGGWAVRRDGGVFDQFTGATVTPRAVVSRVYKALQYFSLHEEDIFDAPSGSTLPRVPAPEPEE